MAIQEERNRPVGWFRIQRSSSMNLYTLAVSKNLVVGFRFCWLALVSLGLISSVGCRGSAPQESATSDAESPTEAGAPSAEEPTGETYPRAQEPATAPPVATTPALEAPSPATPTPSQAPAPSPKSHARVSAPEPVPTEPPRAEPPPPPEIVDVEVAAGTILELELFDTTGLFREPHQRRAAGANALTAICQG